MNGECSWAGDGTTIVSPSIDTKKVSIDTGKVSIGGE